MGRSPGGLGSSVVGNVTKSGDFCEVKDRFFPDFGVPELFVLDRGGEDAVPRFAGCEAVLRGPG